MIVSNTAYITHLGKGHKKSDGELFSRESPFHCVDHACSSWRYHAKSKRCDKDSRLVVVFDGPGTFCLTKNLYKNISFVNPNSTNQDVVLKLSTSRSCTTTLQNVSFSNLTIEIINDDPIGENDVPLITTEETVVFDDDTILIITTGQPNSNPALLTMPIQAPFHRQVSSQAHTNSILQFNPNMPLACPCDTKDKDKDKDKCIECKVPEILQIYEPPFSPLPIVPLSVVFNVKPGSTMLNTSLSAGTHFGAIPFVFVDNEGAYSGVIPVSISAAVTRYFVNRGVGIMQIGQKDAHDETKFTVGNWTSSAILVTENRNVSMDLVHFILQNTNITGLTPAPPPVIVRSNLTSFDSNFPILFRYTGPEVQAGIGLPSDLIFNNIKITNLTNQTLLLTNILNYRGTVSISGQLVITGQTMLDNATGPIGATLNDSSHLTNGSLFLLYRTITNNFTHTQYDGQVFHIDASLECLKTGITIILPNDPLWNGRILQYKRIDNDECTDVVITSDGCIDGKPGRVIYLDPWDAIELQNRAGHYVVLSQYHRHRRNRKD